MGSITDRWQVSFTMGPFSKEFGSVTVRASNPAKAMSRFSEIVTADVEITVMEKINAER